MLSINEAMKIVEKHIPDCEIQKCIIHNGLYVFMVYTADELEGQMDPFYSVNMKTGDFRDFSIITDGNISDLMRKFESGNLIK